MSAIISECGKYRYRLERNVQLAGPTFAYFGVNPSTADAMVDDQTVRKWIGFTRANGGRRFIVGNAFAFRGTDVNELADLDDATAIGPVNSAHIATIIAEADVLIPCWGSRRKLPRRLWDRLDWLLDLLLASNRPVRTFGLSKSGDPLHVLTLAYSTPLLDLRLPGHGVEG